jgi:polyisoprenoid-binding protein YceI
VSKSTVDVTIAAGDIDTREPKRDEHLKSEAFFDVKRFPEIRFTATRVQPVGKNGLRVTGNLTLHGITRPVELAVELGDKVWKDTFPEHGEFGRLHWGVTATTKLNRRDFGLTWNVSPGELKFVEAGGVVVGDEVTVELDIELVRPAPAGS